VASSSVCIAYCEAQTKQSTPEIREKLVKDLRAAGSEVIEVTLDGQDISDQHFLEFLKRELIHCHWLILLDTPEALHSLRVQTAVSTALNVVGQTRMKGVLRILTAPETSLDKQEVPVPWNIKRTFDASQDYERALKGLLLELDLIPLEEPVDTPSARPPSSPLELEKEESVDQPHQGRKTRDLSSDSIKQSPSLQPNVRGRSSLLLLQRLRYPWLAWVAAPISLPRYVLVALAILIILVPFIACFAFNAGNSAGFHAGSSTGFRTGSTDAYINAQSTATAFVNTHATAIAVSAIESLDPYFPPDQGGSVAFNDPLVDNNRGNSWAPSNTTATESCKFSSNGYEVLQSSAGLLTYCVTAKTSFAIFAYQVTMTMHKGDQGGLIFCVNNIDNNHIEHARFYYFHVKADADSSGNWVYEVGWIDLRNPSSARQIHTVHSPYIHSQFGQANLLAVAVDNGVLNLYINKHKVDQIADTTYTSGAVGVFAKDETKATDIVFNDAIVWQL
jgi:hypothetical protein